MKFLGYFVLVLFSSVAAFAAKPVGTLHITPLDEKDAKTLVVSMSSLKTLSLEFYVFYREEDHICFTGPSEQAAQIVDAILNVTTGDAWVYPEVARVKTDQIQQIVKFVDEGGEHEFSINVLRCK